ncbi:hypothetical protein HZA33_03490, partial [Candidatus Pacearchaeota archaeon]|nr:hypothetical protein [Candidatus Pacearchaeota archaeon]
GKNYAKACAATVGTVIVGPALGILSIPAILAGLGFTSVMAYQSYRDYEELDKQGFK